MPNTFNSRSPLPALAIFAFRRLTRPYARYRVLGAGSSIWHTVHWA